MPAGRTATGSGPGRSRLAKLAKETGLEITVCHSPPGTSKWNKIVLYTGFPGVYEETNAADRSPPTGSSSSSSRTRRRKRV
jgi:hypothetical protein